MIDVPTDLPDEVLVARIQGGETALFVVLMRRHNRSVYRMIRSVVRDEAAVEDVMQDTYVNAFTHLRELAGRGAFASWLRQIAFREALHRARRVRSSPFSQTPLDTLAPRSPQANPEREAGRGELKIALECAIDGLQDDYREVFMLRTVEGCSVAETASVLGVHEETVKTRLHRARSRLQELLASWTDHDAPDAFDFPAVRCARVSGGVLERLKFPA